MHMRLKVLLVLNSCINCDTSLIRVLHIIIRITDSKYIVLHIAINGTSFQNKELSMQHVITSHFYIKVHTTGYNHAVKKTLLIESSISPQRAHSGKITSPASKDFLPIQGAFRNINQV